ncbi:MAG: hypothetical protein PUI31_04835 [Clostridia bacterium]|nr:hypothetical protein [Clostridia bacterium]
MIKKFIALALCLSVLLSVAACGGDNPGGNGGNNGEVKFYEYADDKEIFLSGYLQSWEINEEQFKWVKESGINHYYINLSSTVSRMSASLEYCDQFGLKAIPMTCWGSNDKKSFTEHPLDATIRDYESFDGYNILDEPRVEDYDWLAEEYAKFSTAHPDKVFYTNLLRPGNPSNNFSYDRKIDYDTYVGEFVEKVVSPIQGKKVMSMTLYPMLIDAATREKSIMDSHLTDLGRFARVCGEAGADMYHFVQAVSFKNHHVPSEADIRFQIYSGMAFGTKGFQYFTFGTPQTNHEFSTQDYAMINPDNQRTTIYYGVQKVNRELSKFDHVYLNFERESIMLVDGQTSSTEPEEFILYRANSSLPVTESTALVSEVSASRDTLIGVLKDKTNGRDGYVVVNYTVPSQNLSDTVNMKINASAVMVYVGGEEYRIKSGEEITAGDKTVSFKRGVLNVNLDAGEGIFVIPVV